MKKIISLILTLSIIICALPISVFATDCTRKTRNIGGVEISIASIDKIVQETGKTTETVIDIIKNDMEILYGDYDGTSYLTDVRYENGRIEYEFDLPAVSDPSIISLAKDINGNITYYITEGDCNDILSFKADGTIILNGSKVTVTEVNSVEAEKDVGSGPQRARYNQFSKNNLCPGATYVKNGTPKPYIIDTGNNILKDIAINTLAILIGVAIPGIPGAVAGALFSIIAGQIKSTAAAYCPTSTAASCKIQKYDKSPQSPLEYYYKYVGDYYSNTNYSVYAGTSTYYECNYFS